MKINKLEKRNQILLYKLENLQRRNKTLRDLRDADNKIADFINSKITIQTPYPLEFIQVSFTIDDLGATFHE